MKNQLIAISLTVLAVLVILFAWLNASRPIDEKLISEGQSCTTAPAWSARDITGKVANSANFRGKTVLISFWATWCPACREEIPGFIELQKRFDKDGLIIVGASVDEDADDVKQMAKASGINYPIVLASEELQAAFGGIESLPTTFIFDRQGQLAGKFVGFASEETLQNKIKSLVAESEQSSCVCDH